MKKVTIIGDGGWGTALATVLARNGHRVTVWGPFEDYVSRTQNERVNTKFLPGVELPDEIGFTSDTGTAAADADAVVLAVPSRYFRDVVSRFCGLLPDAAPVVSVTKGLDRDTGRRMSEVAAEILDREPIAALSGPSHAEEVALAIPSAVVIGCADHDQAIALQDLFMNETFRIYTSEDIVGVELGGALKNVIAVAAGVSDGIGFGDNSKAALITRGLAEIIRLGVRLGAQPETFAGLSGIGDLVVTCTSRHSRNRGVGERIGRGENPGTILGSMEQVAEGIWTCATARDLAGRHDVEVPITEEVCALIHEGKDSAEAVRDLMTRDPKPETA